MSEWNIKLYYDIVSPYSYLAFEQLTRLSNLWGFTLILVPAYLGGVMHATENKPPATNPTKARYLVQDIQRSAQLCKIKLRKPKEFPAQSVLAMRCLVLLQRRESRELMVNASRVLWEFYWTEQGDISDFEAIRRILLEKLNIRVSEEEINALEVKDALKKNTRDAVDLGAFGFPWMLVYKNGEEHKGKIVFGSDRFAHIAQIMGLNVQEYMPPKSRI